MLSATTRDSASVTVDYRVEGTVGLAALRFGVYRSADSRFDSADSLLGASSAVVDDSGVSALSAGTHELTVPLPGGLPPFPRKPYVLVVANPDDPAATNTPQQTAAFRTYVVGVVTHGGLINSSWKHGPPWQLQTAVLLRQQGYDAVIPYSWVSDSGKAGRAARQGPRLARRIVTVAAAFPPGSPVDVHFIGHSEGAVVNTQAIAALEKTMTPELRAGYILDTLLDPHAANNRAPGQASVSNGLLGSLAGWLISNYQSQARDPLAYIPSIVDSAQVFYQRTNVRDGRDINGGLYNLWGQVPVANLSGQPIAYYNLTAAGATHSGNYGVALWYRNFVAPTLGNQATWIESLRLAGGVDGSTPTGVVSRSAMVRRSVRRWGPFEVVRGPRPEFSGTALPGSKVRVFLGPAADPSSIASAGSTSADTEGKWTLTGPRLRQGRYRAIAMAFARSLRTRPGLRVVPMTPLGRFTIRR